MLRSISFLGAKARAIMRTGALPLPSTMYRALAPSVLRHRILTNFNAEAEGVTSLAIIERLLEVVRPEAVDVALAS